MLASPIFLTTFFFSSFLCKSTESGNFIWNAEVKGELPEVCTSKYHKQNRNDLLEQFEREQSNMAGLSSWE